MVLGGARVDWSLLPLLALLMFRSAASGDGKRTGKRGKWLRAGRTLRQEEHAMAEAARRRNDATGLLSSRHDMRSSSSSASAMGRGAGVNHARGNPTARSCVGRSRSPRCSRRPTRSSTPATRQRPTSTSHTGMRVVRECLQLQPSLSMKALRRFQPSWSRYGTMAILCLALWFSYARADDDLDAANRAYA